MQYKILNTIGQKFTPSAKQILLEIGDVDYVEISQDELLKIIGRYNILLVGLGLNVDREVINRAKNLRYVATATTGLDHIDVDYSEKKGIKVLSLCGETDFLNTITGTSELAFGLMIDLMRKTHSAFNSVKNYEWDRERFRGHNLYGQTLGVVGLGRLGRWMAKYGLACGMKVLCFDPNIKQNIFNELGVDKVSFDDLLGRSDAVSIHVHLNESTENLFNSASFFKMKNSAFLINTSRGKIVNERDLLKALKNKQIAGYATDVLADELNFDQGFSKHPLVEYSKNHDNLIIVPHIGGMTYESREATDIFIAKQLVDFFK